ncbi:MAG: sodium ion-translocating decarboxylase subunit beta [Holophagales bacterium]|nr:sodium ion-translocating decarboxylase subunit beta [Holophagales bacterium]
MKKLLLLLLTALFASCLLAERPTFGVTFIPGEIYIRFDKGKRHGLRQDFQPPKSMPNGDALKDLFGKEVQFDYPKQPSTASRGDIKDVFGNKIGTFVVVYADDFQSVARVDSLNQGAKIEDGDHLEIPNKELSAGIKNLRDLSYVKFRIENSENYFYIRKGILEIKTSNFKRGAKSNLYDANDAKGKFVGICTVEVIADNISLGRVTQYSAGYFAKDVQSGRVTGYFDQIVGGSGFANITWGNIIMVIVAFGFLYLAIAKDYEPLLLCPIAFGILVGNMPMPLSIFNSVSVYMIDPVTHEYVFNTGGNSVLGLIYYGVKSGFLPPLIFLGIGALTDFSALLSNPKSLLLGAAAQFGIYAAFIGSLWFGFSPQSAASIGIIGGADGPTAIFTASRLAPSLIGPIAIAAYSYMAMVPVIQPPIMKLLTTKQERLIRMTPGRKVSKFEKVAFPVGALIVTVLVAPGGLPLLGPLFLGNLLRESGVTTRLAKTASSALLDICTIFIGFGVGASTSAAVFLKPDSIKIFAMGCVAFSFATASGVMFAKIMNVFSKEKVNPLIGAAGVSAVPDSARVAHIVGQQEDPGNFLLQHAMGPNVAGVIGSAIAAGIFLGLF